MVYPPKDQPRITSSKFTTDYLLSGSLVVGLILLLISRTISNMVPDFSGARFIDEFIFFALLAIIILLVLVSGRLYLSNLLPFIIVFSMIGAFASFYNQVPLLIAILGFLLAIKPLVLLISFQMLPISKDGVSRNISWLHNLMIIILAVSLGYMVVFEILLQNNPLPGIDQPSRFFGLSPMRSFYRHPSAFSSIMTLTGIYFFARFLIKGKQRNLIYVGFGLIAVVLTARMKAIFLLPATLLLLFILIKFHRWKIKKNDLIKLLLILCIVVVLASIFIYLMQDLLVTRIFGSANTVRAVLHKQALQILKDTNGLGAGFGMYGSSVSVTTHYSPLYDRYGISSMYGATPDNSAFITDQWWAWYLGETGAAGIAVFLLALLSVILGLWRISMHWYQRRPEMAVLGFTAITFLIFGILSGYAAVYLTAPPTGYFVMGLAGLVFALDRALTRPRKSTDLSPYEMILEENDL